MLHCCQKDCANQNVIFQKLLLLFFNKFRGCESPEAEFESKDIANTLGLGNTWLHTGGNGADRSLYVFFLHIFTSSFFPTQRSHWDNKLLVCCASAALCQTSGSTSQGNRSVGELSVVFFEWQPLLFQVVWFGCFPPSLLNSLAVVLYFVDPDFGMG